MRIIDIEDLMTKLSKLEAGSYIGVVSYPLYTEIRKAIGASQDVTGITLYGVKLVLTPDNSFTGFSIFPIDESKAFEVDVYEKVTEPIDVTDMPELPDEMGCVLGKKE